MSKPYKRPAAKKKVKLPAKKAYAREAERPTMRKVAAAKLRSNFAETLDAVRINRDRLIIDRHGKSVAAIVPVEDAELLEELENAEDLRVAEKRLRAIREGRAGTISAADLYKKLGL